jgi:hypothetical protein
MWRITIITGMSLAIPTFGQNSELKQIEAESNDTYIQAVTNAKRTHTPEQIENIKDSESKWRAYRNAECKAENGGDTCLIRLTKERIAALKALYLTAGR